MKLLVIGRGEEVTGFALAGAETIACDVPDRAPAIVEEATAAASSAGLVLLSQWVAAHAPRAVTAARLRKGPPVVAVMPG